MITLGCHVFFFFFSFSSLRPEHDQFISFSASLTTKMRTTVKMKNCSRILCDELACDKRDEHTGDKKLRNLLNRRGSALFKK